MEIAKNERLDDVKVVEGLALKFVYERMKKFSKENNAVSEQSLRITQWLLGVLQGEENLAHGVPTVKIVRSPEQRFHWDTLVTVCRSMLMVLEINDPDEELDLWKRLLKQAENQLQNQ